MREPLPPELSRLGDEICAAAERSLSARRRRAQRATRVAATALAGTLAFAVLVPGALGPADRAQELLLASASAESFAIRACDYPRGGFVKYPQACVAPPTGTPFAPRRPYAWR